MLNIIVIRTKNFVQSVVPRYWPKVAVCGSQILVEVLLYSIKVSLAVLARALQYQPAVLL